MGPKKKFNIGRDSGRVEARGYLDGLGDRDAGTVCWHFDKLNKPESTQIRKIQLEMSPESCRPKRKTFQELIKV